MSATMRRLGVVSAAAAAAVAVTAGSASAHHCYVPMYSLAGPTSSNWFVISAEAGADLVAGYRADCDEAADAGYAALRAEGMPVGIKIFEKMTIGDPKGEERIPNLNGADGKGLEYFGAGSTLADEMVATWIAAADAYEC
jgi:hypothetical protein